jgi:hypothetical protein
LCAAIAPAQCQLRKQRARSTHVWQRDHVWQRHLHAARAQHTCVATRSRCTARHPAHLHAPAVLCGHLDCVWQHHDQLAPVTGHLVVHTRLQRLWRGAWGGGTHGLHVCALLCVCGRCCTEGLRTPPATQPNPWQPRDVCCDPATRLAHTCSSVDLPWKPPPAMSVMPARTPMPLTGPLCGSVSVTSRDGGDLKGTSPGCDIMGRSLAPLWVVFVCHGRETCATQGGWARDMHTRRALRAAAGTAAMACTGHAQHTLRLTHLLRGRMEPLATNPTRPAPRSASRAAWLSSTVCRCPKMAAPSSAGKSSDALMALPTRGGRHTAWRVMVGQHGRRCSV